MNNHQIFLENKFKQVAKLIPKNSRILDIGCNDGSLRHFLKNCDYYGVDMDKNLINQLIKQKIKAKQADFNKDEIPFQTIKFDYILLLDILEHVINPKKLLNQAKGKLKPGGKIIITLPNDYHSLNKIRFIFNKNLTQDPFTPYGHLHYFPIKSGENLLIKQGFKILKKQPISPTKPSFLPQSLKDFLSKTFPQSFARDVLYLLSVSNNI